MSSRQDAVEVWDSIDIDECGVVRAEGRWIFPDGREMRHMATEAGIGDLDRWRKLKAEMEADS